MLHFEPETQRANPETPYKLRIRWNSDVYILLVEFLLGRICNMSLCGGLGRCVGFTLGVVDPGRGGLFVLVGVNPFS